MGKLVSGCIAVCVVLSSCSESALPLPANAVAPTGTRAVENHWLVQLRAPSRTAGGKKPMHDAERKDFFDQLDEAGLEPKVLHDYTQLWNGLALELPSKDLGKLARLSTVADVFPVLIVEPPETSATQGDSSEPDLFSALTMTGADLAQNSLGLNGNGIRVGIIDTGVDYRHPDLGGCFGPGCRVAFGTDFVGDNFDSNGSSTPVPDADPLDCAGHGTHVTGITGANGSVKGVAPNVVLGAYRVFGCSGSTSSDIMMAAMERAAQDGMRVVNMSIGSSFEWPQYPSGLAAKALNDLGVVVVTSIGNSGPSGVFAAGVPGTNPGAIGTASIDNLRTTQPAFLLSPDNLKVGFNPATGVPIPPMSGTFPLARTGTTSTTNDACSPLGVGSFTGKVVLIRRGTCSFYIKASNAQAAGAVGVILYNNAAGQLSPTVAGVPAITIPVVGITSADGATIDGRIASTPTTLTWSTQVVQTVQVTAGQVSSFSSWGPTAELDLKPDLAAPGGGIYSTYPLPLGSFASLSGTSMASPHVAGVVALLLQAQPMLTPATIRAQLSNTAVPAMWTDNVTPDSVFRQGAGLVHVDVAAQTRVQVTPQKLPLGESQGGPATRTLTFTNSGATDLVFTASHVGAINVGGNLRVPTLTAGNSASVTFGNPTVTVVAGGTATLDVTITANAAVADATLYSGYLVFTSPSVTLRVPYGGFKGDYQALTVLTGAGQGYPWLASKPGASFVNQPAGATFTLQGTDNPNVVVHYEFFARKQTIEAFDSVTNKPWGLVQADKFIGRLPSATATFAFTWNGTVEFNKGTLLVPNGTYVLKMRTLKALGDENNPADWESWTSPVITLNHP